MSGISVRKSSSRSCDDSVVLEYVSAERSLGVVEEVVDERGVFPQKLNDCILFRYSVANEQNLG